MVNSESAVRWRRAISHQARNCSSLGREVASLAICRSSSSIAIILLVIQLAVHAIVVALVGFDDALYQWVVHHVLGLEVGKADARNVTQHVDDVGQASFGAPRQVALGDVAGDHGGGAETDAGKEHLHLFQGGVLAFVEDDKARSEERRVGKECRSRWS